MARIFISHSSRDKRQAEDLKQWLASSGFDRSFLDFDKHTGIAPGADWERTLYHELERSQAVILVLTKHWFESKWCFAEFTQARAMGKSIFAVIELPTGESTIVSSDIQHLDLTEERSEGLQRLSRELTRVALNAQSGFDWDSTRPPYPGLLSFDASDAAIFFGRDDDVLRVIERVNARRVRGGAKLLAIIGGSGSGKSSLLKAGVLPRLSRDKEHFLIVPAFRPGTDPFRGLLSSLRALDPSLTRADLDSVNLETAADLIDRLRLIAKRPRATLVLAIDQAEEAFTRATGDDCRRFFELMSALVSDPSALGLITLRADHLPDLQAAEGLSVDLEEFSLKPVPMDRLGLIVTGPARVGSLVVEDGLVPALMRDVKGHDALPLVAFVLRRIYDRFGATGHLTVAHYESLRDGSLSPLDVAIRDAANEALEDSRPEQQELAELREAFVPLLVRVNDQGEFVRQSARIDRLPAQSHRLVRRLADMRLLVIETQEGAPVVEVAHESLFRVWPQLASWLEEERDFLIGKSRIDRALEDYVTIREEDREKGLLSGILLERSKNWLSIHPARFSPDETAFIQASAQHAARVEQERVAERERLRNAELARAQAEAKAAEETARGAQERARAAQNLQRIAMAAAVVFAILGGVATKLWFDAAAARQEAESDYRLAIDQAAGNLRQLATNYRAGAISTTVMKSLIERSQKTIQGLPSERFEVTAARAQLLDVLSLAELTLGSVTAALQFAQQELSLAEQLKDQHASDPKWNQLWAQANGRLGQCLFWAGDLMNALDHLRSARGAAERLLADKPADTELQESLLAYIERMGDTFRAQGEFEAAIETYTIWLTRAKTLAEGTPNERRWLAAMADAHQRLGDGFLAMGKADEAAQEFRAYGRIAASVVQRDPNDLIWRQRLSWSYQRLGDALLADNAVEQAISEYNLHFTAAADLYAQDPSNFLWRQDLEVAHQRLGEVFLKQQRFADAVTEFQQYADLAQKTLDRDSSNVIALFDISNALEKLGDTLREQGDFESASEKYQHSLEYANRLHETDSANASWQLLYAVSHQRLAMTMQAKGDWENARKEYERCLEIRINGVPFRPRILWPPDVHEYCRRELETLGGNNR